MILIIIKAPEKRYCVKNHLKIFYTKEETEHKAGDSSTLRLWAQDDLKEPIT